MNYKNLLMEAYLKSLDTNEWKFRTLTCTEDVKLEFQNVEVHFLYEKDDAYEISIQCEEVQGNDVQIVFDVWLITGSGPNEKYWLGIEESSSIPFAVKEKIKMICNHITEKIAEEHVRYRLPHLIGERIEFLDGDSIEILESFSHE